MSFRAYSLIIFGMISLGFSLGLVVGVYLQLRTGSHLWAYLAVPIMGLGSAIAAYGTLSTKMKRGNSEDSDG